MSVPSNAATTTGAEKSPEEVGMELVLVTTKALFTSRKTLRDGVFDHALSHGKTILKRTSESEAVRKNLGHAYDLWKDMNLVFSFAIPVLEIQSITLDVINGSSCAQTMVSNYDTLMPDLIRLNDLLLIARNCLATTPKAQNLAGESLLDQHVLKLIDLCVRVAARGYDGESGGAGTKTEKVWAGVIGMYKKLLITSLQFLHNFITQNEQRKLLLWLDLFANSRIASEYVNGAPNTAGRDQMRDLFEAKLAEAQTPGKPQQQGELATGRDGDEGSRRASVDLSGNGKASKASGKSAHKAQAKDKQHKMEPTNGDSRVDSGVSDSHDAAKPSEAQIENELESAKADFGILTSPESAAVTLQAAKDQLMQRLREPAALDPSQTSEQAPADENGDGQYPEDDEDDYQESGELGDQTRGLLTDIPLVLAPPEIEALPMIIQIAICPGLGSVLHGRDMQSLRCNILLAGESGRNLLRELLIFIAAWDLQDDEHYFLLMKQIMEAILENGLMPYAYQTFAEIKDIVSPAQSMVIKILTQIFRGKHGLSIPNGKDKGGGRAPNPHADASRRVDLYIVRYIFTMFRQSIIPETCALIYLQGQIRAGNASPEDFPLNLWDMERVYEGVYQFLEFFAVLTESEEWKEYLVSWRIVSELTTLLRELDASIPKAPIAPLSQSTEEPTQGDPQQRLQIPTDSSLPVQEDSQPSTAPIVERPFDITDPLPSPDGNPNLASDPYRPASPGQADISESDGASIESADPADFEWRNLKKLVILVLSSLVWKSPKVQNQIRDYGGVQLVLGCVNYDGHNPYIREHAVMCMRFLLEGNPENEAIVSGIMNRKEELEKVVGEDLAEEWIKRGGFEGMEGGP